MQNVKKCVHLLTSQKNTQNIDIFLLQKNICEFRWNSGSYWIIAKIHVVISLKQKLVIEM